MEAEFEIERQNSKLDRRWQETWESIRQKVIFKSYN